MLCSCSFFPPSPSPALLALLPADPSSSRSPRETSLTWGEVSKASGLYQPLSQIQQQMGREREVLRKKSLFSCNLVICCFFSGLVCTPDSEGCWWPGVGWDGDRAATGRRFGWHPFGRGSWVSSVAGPGILSRWTNPESFEPAPCDVALPAAGCTRHLRFPLWSCNARYRDLPGCCLTV